jgi:hypothetical protein
MRKNNWNEGRWVVRKEEERLTGSNSGVRCNGNRREKL